MRSSVAFLALACAVACGSSDAARPTTPTTPSPTGPGTGDDGEGDLSDADRYRAQALADALNATRDAVSECVARAAVDDFRVAGEVALEVRFGAGGRVEAVSPVADDVGDEVLTGCLVALFGDYDWPDDIFEAGNTLRIPLSFEAPSAQHTIQTAYVPTRELADGDLEVDVVMDEDNTGDASAAVSLMKLGPGISVPLHRHPGSDEILLLVRGSGLAYGLRGEDAGTRVGAGWLLRFPAGVAHAYVNDDTTTHAIQIYAPAGPEQRFEGEDVPGGTVPVSDRDEQQPPKDAPRPIALLTTGPAGEGVDAPELSRLPEGGGEPVRVGNPEVAAGAEIAEHTHDEATEIVIVDEGSATVTIAGEVQQVGRGDVVKIPAGVAHGWEVTEDLRAWQFFVSRELFEQ